MGGGSWSKIGNDGNAINNNKHLNKSLGRNQKVNFGRGLGPPSARLRACVRFPSQLVISITERRQPDNVESVGRLIPLLFAFTIDAAIVIIVLFVRLRYNVDHDKRSR